MMRFLVGAIVLVGCYKNPPPAAPPPPTTNATPAPPTTHISRSAIGDPVGFLPKDSELVIAIDGEQVRKSPVWDMAEDRIRKAAGSGLTTFQTACGFDPIASVRSISIGLRGLKQDKPEGVVVLTGMSRTKMTDCMERAASAGGKVVTVDHDVYTLKSDSNDPTAMVFAFVDEATAVIQVGESANRFSLEKILVAGSPLRRSPTFTQYLAQVDTSAAAWGVVNGQSSIFDLASNNQKPTAMWGSLQLDSGASLAMRIRFADAATAQQLTTQMTTQLGSTAQMFFDRLDITADGAEMVIDAAMSESKLQSLLTLMGLAMKSSPPPPPPAPTLGP